MGGTRFGALTPDVCSPPLGDTSVCRVSCPTRGNGHIRRQPPPHWDEGPAVLVSVTAARALGALQGEGWPPGGRTPSHTRSAPCGRDLGQVRAGGHGGNWGACTSAHSRRAPCGLRPPRDPSGSVSQTHVLLDRPCSLLGRPPTCLRGGTFVRQERATLSTGCSDPPTRQHVLLARAPTWR